MIYPIQEKIPRPNILPDVSNTYQGRTFAVAPSWMARRAKQEETGEQIRKGDSVTHKLKCYTSANEVKI